MRAESGDPAGDDWFTRPDELIGHLRGLRSSEAPTPTVHGYEDLVFLQQGGQGTVYLAERSRDGCRVALKVFHEDSFSRSAVRRRFEREIYLVSRLKHPNIVRLFQWGRTQAGHSFLSMEFVEGANLEDELEERDPERVIELFLEICEALGHAHRRGVIHRDLKPSNIRIDSQGHVRLLDFGLAKAVDRDAEGAAAALSATGDFVGTLLWASPEQLSGRPEDVDTRTDIYALGLLLYRALTGEHPYPADGSVAALARHIEETVPRAPSRLQEGLARDLDTVVLRCLAKDPERRYQAVDDLARDLRHVLAGEAIEARRDGLAFALRSQARKHPFAAALSVLFVLALAGFTIVSTLLYREARAAEEVARAALDAKLYEAEKSAYLNEFLLGSFLGVTADPKGARERTLEEAIDRAAPQIESAPGLQDRPDVRADLNLAFSFWYGALDDRLEDAEAHALDALGLYDTLDGDHDFGRAGALEALAGVHMRRGEYEQAREVFAESLSLYRASGGDELNVARLVGRLASCAFALQEFEGIRALLEESLAIVQRRVGAENPRARGIQRALDALPGD